MCNEANFLLGDHKNNRNKFNTFTFTSKPIPMYNKLDTSY